MNSTPNKGRSTGNPKPVESRSLLRSVFWAGVSLAVGCAGGIFLHYLIYRLSLPTEPFIYANF
jgi:hypothetical protein